MLGKMTVRVSLLVVALLVTTALISFAVVSGVWRQRLLDAFVGRTESVAENIAAAAGYGLVSKDLLALDNLVSKTKERDREVRYVAIADPSMRIIVHSETMRNGASLPPAADSVFRRSPSGTVVYEVPGDVGGVLEVRSPIRFMQREFGSVVVGVDRGALLENQRGASRRALAVFAAALAGALALGVAGFWALSARFLRPIRDIAVGVDELRREAGHSSLAVHAPDGMGRLAVDFNDLSAMIREQRDTIGGQSRMIEDAYVATVRIIAASIDARDHYTHGHSSRVASVASSIGEELGLLDDELKDLVIACLFHDVGKIRMPDAILRKQGRLDPVEEREMKRHPLHGAEILSHATFLLKYVPAVLHHHERYDGSGYPDGIKGDRIPLSAAIICVADAYDAMTSDRPYRRAMPANDAKREIARFAGIQFHPLLVAALLAAECPA